MDSAPASSSCGAAGRKHGVAEGDGHQRNFPHGRQLSCAGAADSGLRAATSAGREGATARLEVGEGPDRRVPLRLGEAGERRVGLELPFEELPLEPEALGDAHLDARRLGGDAGEGGGGAGGGGEEGGLALEELVVVLEAGGGEGLEAGLGVGEGGEAIREAALGVCVGWRERGSGRRVQRSVRRDGGVWARGPGGWARLRARSGSGARRRCWSRAR